MLRLNRQLGEPVSLISAPSEVILFCEPGVSPGFFINACTPGMLSRGGVSRTVAITSTNRLETAATLAVEN
jgi:hypothetical protein